MFGETCQRLPSLWPRHPLTTREEREGAVFEQVEELVREHGELEKQLADPGVHSDQNRARTLGRRYSELGPIVATYAAWKATAGDLDAARELGDDDASFRAEVPALERRLAELEDKLRLQLLPKDPNDDKDVILEVKAGEGGEES